MQRFPILLVLLAACSGAGTDTDTDGPAPTFTEVRDTVFPSCSLPSCHGGGDAGGLLLTADMDATALVNVPSNDAPGEILVIPGDPDNSYIVKKLEDAPDIVGDPMPPPFGGVDEAHIEMIRAWIAAGAENN